MSAMPPSAAYRAKTPVMSARPIATSPICTAQSPVDTIHVCPAIHLKRGASGPCAALKYDRQLQPSFCISFQHPS